MSKLLKEVSIRAVSASIMAEPPELPGGILIVESPAASELPSEPHETARNITAIRNSFFISYFFYTSSISLPARGFESASRNAE